MSSRAPGSIPVAIARLGFADPARAKSLLDDPALADLIRTPRRTSRPRGSPPRSREVPDPDGALLGLVRFMESVRREPALRARSRPRWAPPGRPGSGCSPCSAARPRSATTCARTPSTGRRSPRRRRCPSDERVRRLVTAVTDPGPVSPVGRAAHGLPRAAARHRGPRPHLARTRRSPSPRRAGALADLAQAALEAALAIARAEVGPDADRTRLAVIAHGQDRRLRAELRLRRRRHLRRRAGRGRATRSESTAVATDLATRLMRICSASTAGRVAVAGRRRRCAPRARTARWCAPLASHRAYYERWAKTWEFQALLKARPSRATPRWERPTSTRCSRWCGRPSSREQLRRRRAGDAPPGRAAHPGRRGRPRSSSSAPAACATSSSRCSCCSSCTAAPTRRCAPAPRSTALAALVRRGLRRAATTPRRSATAYRLPAHPRAPHPAVPAAPHAPDADGRERPAPARSGSGTPLLARGGRGRAVARTAARGAPAARADLLPAAAVGGRPALRLRRAPHARGRARAARGARLPRPARRAAPPRGADRRHQPAGRHPAHSCCR